MSSDTGRRLKEIRSKTQLSQRQLAKASGVANATISQIESGSLNPTVGMLKKVLDGIPISLSDFFSEQFEFSEQVFFKADELVELGRRRRLFPPGGQASAQQSHTVTQRALCARGHHRKARHQP